VSKSAIDGHTEPEQKWTETGLWPQDEEMFTAIVGWGSGRGYINFCPEVSFDRFGRFASGLTQYYNAQEQSDEQERDSYKENIPAWRANWSSITAMHYTECPLYSPLVSTKDSVSPERNSGADNKPIIGGGSWPSWARWRPDNRS